MNGVKKDIVLNFKRYPIVQHGVLLNYWTPTTPTRNINFLQKCKDCLNSLSKCPNKHDDVCKLSEECCSAQEATMEGASAPVAPVATKPQWSANVVIIGAGMAGLSAANHLYNHGVDNVTVLEATQRPGGRIRSCFFGDSVIECGSPTGSPAKNPIVQRAFEDGFTKPILNNADPSRGLLLRTNGSVIPFPITFAVYQKFKAIWTQAHAIEESGESRQSAIQFIGSRVQQEIRTFPSNQQLEAERVFHGLICLATYKSNHDTSLIKSTDLGDFIQLPGSKIKVPLGHFAKINYLYEALPQDQIHFGKTVCKIKWGGVSDIFPRAVVVCENGESYPADYVIITIPLGVLKALVDTLFCPGLPASKLDAILKIPTGHNNKIFLEFSKPFWMWKKDFSEVKFELKDMNCKEGWVKGVCSVQPIRGSSHVLEVSVAGPQAQCMEYLSDKDLVTDILGLLKEASNTSVPEPVRVVRSCWSSDPNYYGAYTYKAPGVSSKDFYELAAPLPEDSDDCDPVLLFAGEATCPVHYGTVQAAKSSGIREAERLLQLIRLRNQMNCDCLTLQQATN